MNLDRWDIKLVRGTDGWVAFGKLEEELKMQVTGFGETSKQALKCLSVCIDSQINANAKEKLNK